MMKLTTTVAEMKERSLEENQDEQKINGSDLITRSETTGPVNNPSRHNGGPGNKSDSAILRPPEDSLGLLTEGRRHSPPLLPKI